MWNEVGHQSRAYVRLTRLAVVCGLLLVGAGLGALTTVVNPMYLLIGALGVPILVVVALRPDWGVFVLLGSVFTFEFTTGGLVAYNITASDGIVATLFLGTLMLIVQRARPPAMLTVLVPFGLYILVGLLAGWYAEQFNLAFPRIMQFVLFAMAAFSVAQLFSLNLPWRRILLILMAGGLILSVIILYTLVVVLRFSKNIDVINTNSWGQILDLITPLVLAYVLLQDRAKVSPWVWAVAATLLAGSAATLSRGSYLGIVAGVLVVILVSGPVRALKIAPLALAVWVAIYYVVPAETVGDVGSSRTFTYFRSYQWDAIWQYFLGHPFLGLGFDGLARIQIPGPYGLLNTTDPHNFIVRVAGETGIPGVILVASILLVVGRRLILNYLALRQVEPGLAVLNAGMLGGMVAYMVHELFDVFWVRGSGLLFWIYVGLAYATASIMTQPQREESQRQLDTRMEYPRQVEDSAGKRNSAGRGLL
jgi:hypothetical protein